MLLDSIPGCFECNFDSRMLLWQGQLPSVAVSRWSLCLEAAAVVMTAALSLKGKHLSRSGLVRMNPLGDFAATATAARMTVETRVCYCFDDTVEVSHELLEQATDG